ncbi:GNAT family N-acetyltransferase [Methylobacterium planeticum]|uniref:GNAT family N-acetyltransferase n=1 Tax=Methylobacterium planeticum TaxID=2615211 RepID=A0A6N6MSJ3_9HYPH|nr:GNAT family N-acetyltransferase [Methylobacterium planeticum]KAB1074261.1 GNAT family N-acetyltransferase [Methylobacterium planeticum]
MFFRRRPSRDSLADLPGLETARLRIAGLAPGDAEAVRTLTDDPAITGAVDFLHAPFTLEDAQDLIRSGHRGSDRFLGAWLRERQGSQREGLVGVVGTHLRGPGAIEIGYWIGGAARGQGFASEAVDGILALLSRRFPHRLIVAECRPGNVASWDLLHKLGFRETGEEGHRPGRRLLEFKPV